MAIQPISGQSLAQLSQPAINPMDIVQSYATGREFQQKEAQAQQLSELRGLQAQQAQQKMAQDRLDATYQAGQRLLQKTAQETKYPSTKASPAEWLEFSQAQELGGYSATAKWAREKADILIGGGKIDKKHWTKEKKLISEVDEANQLYTNNPTERNLQKLEQSQQAVTKALLIRETKPKPTPKPIRAETVKEQFSQSLGATGFIDAPSNKEYKAFTDRLNVMADKLADQRLPVDSGTLINKAKEWLSDPEIRQKYIEEGMIGSEPKDDWADAILADLEQWAISGTTTAAVTPTTLRNIAQETPEKRSADQLRSLYGRK